MYLVFFWKFRKKGFYTGRFKKSVTVLNICHFLIIWPTSFSFSFSFSFSMFGDDVLTFVVVEVPVSRRSGVHTRTKKSKSSNFWTKPNRTSQSVADSVMSLNSYHVMHPAASSSWFLCSTWIAQVPCTLHNTHKVSSAVTMSQAGIDAVRESVAASPPKNLTDIVHRSWDSLTLFYLLLSVYPSWILCNGKTSTL